MARINANAKKLKPNTPTSLLFISISHFKFYYVNNTVYNIK